MNLLKSFWSIVSPKLLEKCKTGVSINPPQPVKKPKRRVSGRAMTLGMVLGGWK
jgi:hypothetical protein